MRLILSDGGHFEGQTYEELAEKIWRSSKFDQSETLEEYMTGFANRTKLYNGMEIRTETAELFVGDLVATGLGTLSNNS